MTAVYASYVLIVISNLKNCLSTNVYFFFRLQYIETRHNNEQNNVEFFFEGCLDMDIKFLGLTCL